MSTATILYTFESRAGSVAVVKLSPPLVETSWDEIKTEHQYVISSAVELPAMLSMFDAATCETYLFPAKADVAESGSKPEDLNEIVSDWGELPGSIKGVKDHEAALTEAGYDTIVYAEPAEPTS